MAKIPNPLVVQCEVTVRVGRPTFPISADRLIELKRVCNEDELLEIVNRLQAVCEEFDNEIKEDDGGS